MLPETSGNQSDSKAIFWKRHIESCDRSSLSQAAYCKEHRLALSTFRYWKKRLKVTVEDKARFYPLTVQSAPRRNPPSPTAGLSLHLGKGKYRVDLSEGFSASTLKELITTLEQL